MRLLICVIALVFSGDPGQSQVAEEEPCWIVVVSRQLDEVIEPLCEHRRRQGYDVVVVHVEDFAAPEDLTRSKALKSKLLELYAASPGKDYVLLVGDMFKMNPEDEDWPRVPPALGTVARMVNQPTDNSYGCSGDSLVPDVAVGRFPAGTAEEVKLMVNKTIAFEMQSAVRKSADFAWTNRINMIVGHPGGTNSLERSMSEAFVNNAINEGFARIHPLWQIESLVHTSSSPFYLHQSQLNTQTGKLFHDDPDLFTIFLGHSNARGFASTGGYFFEHDDWQSLDSPHCAGVLFSCGCFGSQISGPGGEGYAQASMRAPGGAAAAIGATGLSYAAAGKWAIDGFFQCLETDEPPSLLGDYWTAALNGIAKSPMPDEVFLALDQADGSRGNSSMADQRNEHLEMWILFGDPAMKIPAAEANLDFEVGWQQKDANLEITVALPGKPEWTDANVRVILERPLDSGAAGLHRVRRRKELEQLDLIQENWHMSNRYEIVTKQATWGPDGLRAVMVLPDDAKYERLIIRVMANKNDRQAIGVTSLKLDVSR